MKNLINFSKFAIAALISSSLFVACSEEISENTVDTQYTANTGSIKNAGQAVDLGLPSGTKWANMNVGATSESDNGVLFVWGDVTGTQVLATSSTPPGPWRPAAGRSPPHGAPPRFPPR